MLVSNREAVGDHSPVLGQDGNADAEQDGDPERVPDVPARCDARRCPPARIARDEMEGAAERRARHDGTCVINSTENGVDELTGEGQILGVTDFDRCNQFEQIDYTPFDPSLKRTEAVVRDPTGACQNGLDRAIGDQ